MPALRKSVIDVQAADGLQQKVDVRRLPLGKSARAVNLVKNKQGILEKRLGLDELTQTDPLGSNYVPSTGVTLGTWNSEKGDALLSVTRGSWSATETATVLQSYSDELGGPVVQSLMPDLNVVVDREIASSNGYVTSPQSAIIDNFLLAVWVDAGPLPETQPSNGQLMWEVVDVQEAKTVLGPASFSGGTTEVQFHRVLAVGDTFVVLYSDASLPGTISAFTATTTTLTTGGTWTGPTLITSSNASGPNNQDGSASSGSFTARAVVGDSANFVLLYANSRNIVLDKRPASAPGSLTATVALDTGSSSNVAFGVRAGTDTNSAACAWVTISGSGPSYTINAAAVNYTTFAITDISTLLYTAADSSEAPPFFMTVDYCGLVNGHPRYVESHTPAGAVWNASFTFASQFNAGYGNTLIGLPQTYANRLVTTTTSTTSNKFFPSNNARVLQNVFFLQQSGGAVQLVTQLSGGAATGNTQSNVVVTPGVTLASNGYEANGKVYYNTWIPSNTQGGFLAMVFDLAALHVIDPLSGNGYPMRAVANLQTRNATCDPGYGLMPNPNPASAVTGATQHVIAGPNCWTGGSDWCPVAGDHYGTAYVSYVAAAQGARLSPAIGGLETLPSSGYPSTQWGTMTAFGGALPGAYSGANFTEQNFLYTIESVIAEFVDSTGGTNIGLQWVANTSYSWIFTWEWFDEQGNFNISARSTPVTISDSDLNSAGFSLHTGSLVGTPTFIIPTLGPTYKMEPVNMRVASNDLRNFQPPIGAKVTLGVYRTGRSDGPDAKTYFRVNDRYFNGADEALIGFADTLPPLASNTFVSTYASGATGQAICTISFADTVPDVSGFGSTPSTGTDWGLLDGTHPLLYGDGTDGAPGALDNFCPPASPVIVRHKERLFVVRDNLVMFTKARGEKSGPGYNEQVNAIFVGGDDTITGLESQDTNLLAFKQTQVYYISGEGPADNGSGSSFQNPQPIPTDVGCVDFRSVKSTPEGTYYMSTAGLRRVSRGLVIEYVGGPVEDELDTYDVVLSALIYPQANRFLLLAATTDYANGNGQVLGEIVVRDYVLDAWTTALVMDGETQKGFVSAVVANAFGGATQATPGYVKPTLHALTADGAIWRERFVQDATPYFDRSTYVSSIWATGVIKQEDAGRFRLWDILVNGISNDPHGLQVSVAIDYGDLGAPDVWTWNVPGGNNIAPGGSTATPITQMDAYDGRMGEAFQIQVQDVSDTATVTGQGFSVLGCSLAIGTYYGPYKAPPSTKQ